MNISAERLSREELDELVNSLDYECYRIKVDDKYGDYGLVGFAVFEIKDNGCGINPKYLETLFTGYRTSEGEVADTQRKNAGIGLSVCATIIKAHGGNIKAENLKSGGAVFRFELNTEKLNYDTE